MEVFYTLYIKETEHILDICKDICEVTLNLSPQRKTDRKYKNNNHKTSGVCRSPLTIIQEKREEPLGENKSRGMRKEDACFSSLLTRLQAL